MCCASAWVLLERQFQMMSQNDVVFVITPSETGNVLFRIPHLCSKGENGGCGVKPAVYDSLPGKCLEHRNATACASCLSMLSQAFRAKALHTAHLQMMRGCKPSPLSAIPSPCLAFSPQIARPQCQSWHALKDSMQIQHLWPLQVTHESACNKGLSQARGCVVRRWIL